MARWHINFKRIFNLSPSMTMTNDAAESVGMFGETLRCLTGERRGGGSCNSGSSSLLFMLCHNNAIKASMASGYKI